MTYAPGARYIDQIRFEKVRTRTEPSDSKFEKRN